MTYCVAPPTVIVTQPAADLNRVPELFEADAKNWFLFCCFGYFAGWCTACYLGMKYQVQLIEFTENISNSSFDATGFCGYYPEFWW